MGECVLVTATEFGKAESVFRSAAGLDAEPIAPDEDVLAARVTARGCRAVVVGVDRYGGALYEALGVTGGDRGAIIARFGVGHDGIDKGLAGRYGIVVTNTPGVLAVSVAEHAVGLMVCLARRIPGLDAATKAGGFSPVMGVELRGKVLGIVGLGAIGRRVAGIARFGFGMRVAACDQYPEAQVAKEALGVERYTTDVDSVLREADVVSIHLPANAATHHFFDGGRFSMIKRGAIVVNTSRGVVVDEAGLYDALAGGHLGGAGLDVFETEPYEPVSAGKDLRTLPNVVLTPHVASSTVGACEGMARGCLRNIEAFFSGRRESLTRVDG